MKRSGLILVLFCLSAVPVFAQTTGGILGKVTDTSGAALPGVTVEAKSRALQGTRTAVSESDGAYRFALLPPGEYAVRLQSQRLRAGDAHNVVVALGKDSTLDVTLRLASVTEEVTVSAEAPVLDTTSTTLGTNLSTRAIETLPTGRNYASIVQVAPGVSSDANPSNGTQSTISVYGSSGAENAFYIDGVNTTNMEYGFQGKELNFEFISEVDVKTGGYEAEFGRSTGGIINVITKSGGNQFNGDVFGYHDSDSLQSNADAVVSTSGTQAGFTRSDYGADVGGFIMRDRLWFFAAYDGVRNSVENSLPEGPRAGSVVSSKSRRNLGSGKLTYNLGAEPVAGRNVPSGSARRHRRDQRRQPHAQRRSEHVPRTPGLRRTRLRAALRRIVLRRSGSSPARSRVIAKRTPSVRRRAAGNAIEYPRRVERLLPDRRLRPHSGQELSIASTTRRRSRTSLTGHEIKGGLEYEQASADVTKRMSGGQQVDVFANPVNPAKPIYSHFYWTTPDATVANAPLSQLVSSPEHKRHDRVSAGSLERERTASS